MNPWTVILANLFFDIIPKSVDEYATFLNKFHFEEKPHLYNNPVWHIHSGQPPEPESEITFNTLMNLVSVCNSTDKEVIWSFVNEYDSSLNAKNNPVFDKLIQFAINYYIWKSDW